MKQVAKRALHRSHRYVLIYEHEYEVLDGLPYWMERLFRVLVQLSIYRTGLGQTTYRELVERMAVLQPRTGKRHYVPDQWAVWRALVTFSESHILWRNTGWSQKAGAIFFELAPRTAQARPKAERAPGARTPPTSLDNEQRRGF